MVKKTSKRLRVFAGPNGSGKSVLSQRLKNHDDKRIDLGALVNADDIEKELREKGCFSLSKYYRFQSESVSLKAFAKNYGISAKIEDSNFYNSFSISGDKVYYSKEINSYVAAVIAGFVRQELLQKGESFSFESVFSHEGKLEFIKEARKLGYRVYLYFITTDDPEINVNRVKVRVAKEGHSVPDEKIRSRYYKSLDLLYSAVKHSNRAYLFDNSGAHFELVAEVTDGRKVEITDYDRVLPSWFEKYIFDKSKQF